MSFCPCGRKVQVVACTLDTAFVRKEISHEDRKCTWSRGRDGVWRLTRISRPRFIRFTPDQTPPYNTENLSPEFITRLQAMESSAR